MGEVKKKKKSMSFPAADLQADRVEHFLAKHNHHVVCLLS